MSTNPNQKKQEYDKVRTFNGKRLNFDAFSRSVTSAVPVEVTVADLEHKVRALWANDDRGAEMTAQMPVLVYKLGPETVVLTNWPKVQAFLDENANLPEGKKPGVLKARLVSKQLLKHIETVSIPADRQNEKALAVERDIQASHQADWEARQAQYGERPRFQQREEFGNRQYQSRPPQRNSR